MRVYAAIVKLRIFTARENNVLVVSLLAEWLHNELDNCWAVVETKACVSSGSIVVCRHGNEWDGGQGQEVDCYDTNQLLFM